jgi:hypothetical protein
MKGHEMGGTCCTHREIHEKFYSKILKGKDHLEQVGEDGGQY